MPYQKIWFELQALAWNRPELRERLARVHAEWRAVLQRGLRRPCATSSGSSVPLEALVSLVFTFNEGIMLERLSGIETGHRELLDVDRRLARAEDAVTVELERPTAAGADAGPLPRRGRATSSATASGSSTRSTATGEPTVLLLPTWSIVHSRHWKMQIPYLARHCRVLTFDGRGNGRSDRPAEPDAYREEEFAADALAVMDATGTERAVLVSLSRGAERSLLPRREPPGAGRQAGVHRARPAAAAGYPAR